MEVGAKLTFSGWYMSMGDLQANANKDGFIMKDGVVTKEKNGLIFYKIDGEDGERKISKEALNKFRDFGTSIYGIFTSNISMDEALSLIIEKLEERVLEAYRVKGSIIKLQSKNSNNGG